jgi:hypothetical protein
VRAPGKRRAAVAVVGGMLLGIGLLISWYSSSVYDAAGGVIVGQVAISLGSIFLLPALLTYLLASSEA